MIKLTDILNELSINNPTITPKKVMKYYWMNIDNTDNNNMMEEYIEICQPYIKKYEPNIYIYCTLDSFQKLDLESLNRFYDEMRRLVRKYGQEEILNELSINKPIYFKNNHDLLNVLNNPKYLWFKKELVEKALEALKQQNNEFWDFIIEGWLENEAEYNDDYNYISLNDGYDDILFISTKLEDIDIEGLDGGLLFELNIQGKILYINYC